MTMETLISIIQLAARIESAGYDPHRVWDLFRQLKSRKQYRVRPGRRSKGLTRARRKPKYKWYCVECGADIRTHLCENCGADNTWARFMGSNVKRKGN